MEGEEKKLSEHEFVIRAIKKLRKPPYKGIHSVYSGFNRAFKDYFNANPVEATTKLAQEGKIVTRPVKGSRVPKFLFSVPLKQPRVPFSFLMGTKPGKRTSDNPGFDKHEEGMRRP